MRRVGVFTMVVAITVTLAAGSALAVPAFTTTRVSVKMGGGQALGSSFDPEANEDGRLVVFESDADNLVAGDTNGVRDIFMKNVASGVVKRVSVNSGGGQANGPSVDPAISSDAHFIVYSSDATNLVPGDVNGFRDVFMFDTMTGATSIASVGGAGQGNGDSNHPKVSTDPVVVFDSVATNLIPFDANGAIDDVFARVFSSASTVLISQSTGGMQGNLASTYPDITPGSAIMAFQSLATNLVAGDTNGAEDVFLHRNTGQTQRVSINSGGGQGNGASGRPDLSMGGLLVAFHSDATNLTPGDTNGKRDVFLRSVAAGTTTIMSVRGAIRANGDSSNPSITPSGGWVAFESAATNLVMGDLNGASDIFRRRVGGPAIVRVSVDSGGLEGDGASLTAAASENAALQAIVAYESVADNLVAGDTNGASDIFQFRP